MKKKSENTLGQNIFRLRKAMHMTQETLATQLNVSTQAVSKWETGQAIPDTLLLPIIAATLDTSVDTLMGFVPNYTGLSPYEQRYRTDGFYWGIKPNALAQEVLKLTYPTHPMRLLEIGCGEGRDAVFFARNGFEVTALDVTEAGLEKARRLAEANNVHVRYFQADLKHFRIKENYDVIYSSGVIHHILPEWRNELFEDYREHTVPGGFNAFNVFVQKPYIPVPPDSDGDDDTWYSGELLRLYADWHVPVFQEKEFECSSGNTPHRHCMNILIARKPE